jgi:hypothetical protein
VVAIVDQPTHNLLALRRQALRVASLRGVDRVLVLLGLDQQARLCRVVEIVERDRGRQGAPLLELGRRALALRLRCGRVRLPVPVAAGGGARAGPASALRLPGGATLQVADAGPARRGLAAEHAESDEELDPGADAGFACCSPRSRTSTPPLSGR